MNACLLSLVVLFGLFATPSAQAISEIGYESAYLNTVLPFMQAGEASTFIARDGESLSWVRYVHADPVGTILIVTGRSEPWLKYGEVFYDLYQRGYSVYAYDHRGQGLSRHLVSSNRQIGHVADFADYTRDLEDFVDTVLVPEAKTKLYLIAHSMGGAVAASYLSRGKTPFTAAVLSSPMLTINTKPYAIPVAKAIAGAAVGFGLGEKYAPGHGNFDPTSPFEKNEVTSSKPRFWMSNAVFGAYPASVVGGPSNAWVYHSLVATPKIVRKMKKITTPVLMFQAELDKVVKPEGETDGCAKTTACRLVVVPGANHEVLMEKDAIRGPAFELILKFLH